jgi:hypothetical protein
MAGNLIPVLKQSKHSKVVITSSIAGENANRKVAN